MAEEKENKQEDGAIVQKGVKYGREKYKGKDNGGDNSKLRDGVVASDPYEGREVYQAKIEIINSPYHKWISISKTVEAEQNDMVTTPKVGNGGNGIRWDASMSQKEKGQGQDQKKKSFIHIRILEVLTTDQTQAILNNIS